MSSDQEFPKWTRRVTPSKDDIVFSYEASLHLYALIPEGFIGCLGRRMALVRPNQVKVRPRFLHYYFLTSLWKAQVDASVITGATVDRIPLVRFPNFQIRLPTIDAQDRILEVLSSYDDLIENNRRRVQLLEQSARLLYREWFVHLRFPGHEHVRVVNGVPDGWQRKKLIDLCISVDYGYTASADKEAIGPKFLRITDIVPETIDWASVPYCPIEQSRVAKFRLIEGDIVIARTGATVGHAKRINKRHPEAVFASYLVRLRPGREVDDVMLGVFVESQTYKDYVKANVGGAAQPNVNAQVLAAAEIVVPTSAIQLEFRDFVMPLIDQRELLQIENEKLLAARNLLLPRLMSGEIPI